MKSYRLLSLLITPMLLVSCNDESNTYDNDVLTRQGTPEYVSRQAFFDIPFSDEVYVYPVYPGTEEWNTSFSTIGYQAILERCTVPAEFVENISTSALILSWLDNPMIDFCHFADHPYAKYRNLLINEPGKYLYSEMLSRDDIGSSLLALYKAFLPESDYQFIDRMHSEFIYLVSMEEFNSKMTLEETKEIGRLIIDRDGVKDYVHYIFPLFHLMLGKNFSPAVELFQEHPEYNDFLEWGWGMGPDIDILQPIIETFLNG